MHAMMQCVVQQLPRGHEAYYPIELLELVSEETRGPAFSNWFPFDALFTDGAVADVEKPIKTDTEAEVEAKKDGMPTLRLNTVFTKADAEFSC